MASLADRALLIWPVKGMAIDLGGALSFLIPSCPGPELLEEGGGPGDDEKGEARFKAAMD
jgi:hypothetical protein